MQEQVLLMVQICQLLYTKYNGNKEKAKEWLKTRLDNGETCLSLIDKGYSEWVLNYLIQSM